MQSWSFTAASRPPLLSARMVDMATAEEFAGEEWRDVEGFRGYQVSSHGRVRSCRSKRGGLVAYYHLLDVRPPNVKHPSARLRDDAGKPRIFFVSRLVLEAFVGPSPNQPLLRSSIEHKDGDHLNNHVSNLAWMPRKLSLAERKARIKAMRWSLGTVPKLTPEEEAQEVWKQHPEFPTVEASNFGRIRRETRYEGGEVAWEIAPTANPNKVYQFVGFRSSGVKITRFVHRVVLETFVGPKPKGQQCRHLDGDPQNNRLSNICWGTAVENAEDRFEHGTAYFGESHYNAVLTDAAVVAIRSDFAAKRKTQKQLAEEHGCSIQHISNIILCKRRTLVSDEDGLARDFRVQHQGQQPGLADGKNAGIGGQDGGSTAA